ncbi:DNA-binding protein H-NS-like protein [Rodentibacter caecimuris]|uniref:DNA-binding protein n=1 Tax=Rodentibacter caecimuris TaxID=1796644 RepID=A0A9X8W150_9PAST|nr:MULTISPECIES: H-NS family nucleoid-associated regulatory protein [Pasteurellaceae]AOF54146.1 DNA-binding protein H-NS [Pasteurellaceae bacterium NI1060]MCQ9123011.1 H-NS histone family protein [Rodentibacter heylii]MCX2961467.1 H-NS histone family protein [Rodentibacter heylii]MDC2824943.1 H-NS family nucleoid-associated regulatory protein [Rodentibacter pneumotropicus]OOF70088.1 DNA-binding protein H-NS-like protein [Rodentibacter heylii]
MADLIKIFTNRHSIRAVVRDLTLEQAENTLKKLEEAIAEKRVQMEEIQQAEIERKARIAKYKELIKQEGITAEELQAIIGTFSSNSRKKRKPLPAKYKYTTENGEQKTWTGQGRTPSVIQKALDAGKSLSDFEI